LFATLELGRAFMQYNALTQSVRDGVRFLASNALGGSTGVINISAQTQAQVANLVVYGNSAGTGAPLLPGLVVANIVAAGSSATDITVSASYTYQPVNPVIPSFGLGPDRSSLFVFQAQATMRAL
jgi:hypothetical protein